MLYNCSKADSVKRIKVLLRVLIVISLLGLTGCEMLPENWQLPWQQSAIVNPEATNISLPTGISDPATQELTDQTPTPAPPPAKLILWLPPDLDPNGETAAAAILKDRLEEFAYLNSIEIDVRLKAVSGGGGLLDALRTTHAAAPASSPDVVALTREHLLLAAGDGVLF